MPFAATPAIERLMDRLTLDEKDCWIWEGSTNTHGYGQLWTGTHVEGTRKLRRTHQITFEHFRGKVPEGLTLDHLCRVLLCANPWHLEAVTHRENVQRGNAPTAIAHRTNTCKRGHSLTDAYMQSGRRYCRQCKVLAERAKRAAKRLGYTA